MKAVVRLALYWEHNKEQSDFSLFSLKVGDAGTLRAHCRVSAAGVNYCLNEASLGKLLLYCLLNDDVDGTVCRVQYNSKHSVLCVSHQKRNVRE